jgi:ATP/maltotriose-dependent transcriptional regulator MalT
MRPDSPLNAGRSALDLGDTATALRHFADAVAADAACAEAHEGRALAAWWADDATTVFESRETAYRLYRERGDVQSAARIAVWLAWDHDAFRGEVAVASGWLALARELLAEHHESEAYAWLSVRESAFALLDHGDPEHALQRADEAMHAARLVGSAAFELVGRALRGFSLATSGRVAEGMRELDSVAAAILGGDVRDRLASGLACCYLIAACDRVRDYDRAVEWCRRLKSYTAKWHFLTLFAVCRTQYAAVCMWRGAWTEAEEELEHAASELGAVRPGMVSEALVRLGELRRRQGRLDEALALFERADGHPLGVVGRAMVAADRGEWAMAADLAERHLRQLPPHNRTERAAALELLVRAAVARGKPGDAATPLADLERVAQEANTRPLRALAAVARGVAAAGAAQHDDARKHFEDAVDLYARSGATYERASAMLDLAETLSQLGRAVDAAREAVQAEVLLDGIEAPAHLARARALRDGAQALATSAISANAVSPSAEGDLKGAAGITARERDVLRCIAAGLGNPAIATQLGISEHTVHRHVANTLTKLGVSSRAAAVAQAARQGLL